MWKSMSNPYFRNKIDVDKIVDNFVTYTQQIFSYVDMSVFNMLLTSY